VESLPSKKKDPRKKEEKEKNGARIEKQKKGKPHMKKLHI
jgi:hypothetical protein